MGNLVDGLGFEEVNQEVTSTEIISGTNVFAAGSMTAPKAILTTMSGTNIFSSGSITGPLAVLSTVSGNNVFAAGSMTAPVAVLSTVSGNNLFGAGSLTVPVATITSGYITTVSGTDVKNAGTFYQGGLGSPYAKGTVVNSFIAEAIISGGMWVAVSGASGLATPVAKPSATVTSTMPLGVCLATTASGARPNILTQGTYFGLIADATVNAGQAIGPGSGAALNTVLPGGAGTSRGVALIAGGSEAALTVYLF